MRTAPVLLLIVLLLPSAAAVPTATFTTPHVEIHGGTLSSDLSILRVKIAEGAIPLADFHLTTSLLQLEVDHTDTATGAPAPFYHDPQTTSSLHHDATLTGLKNRVGGALYVLPTPPGSATITLDEVPCLGIDGAPQGRERTEANLKERPPREADTSRSLRLQPCHDAVHVTITGDIWMQLWNWDAHLQSSEGTQTLQTGLQETEGVPIGSASEAFLHASDATLSFTLTRDSTWLLSSNATATGIAKIHVEKPDGALTADGESTPLQGASLEWTGPLSLRVQGTAPGQPIQVNAEGAALAGAQPATAAPPAPVANLLAPTLALFLLGAATVAVVGYERPIRAYTRLYADAVYSTAALHDSGRRERRMRGYAVMAQTALRRGQGGRAQRVLKHLHRRSANPVEALLVEGEVCLNLGNYPESRAAFQAALESAPNRPTQTQARVGLAAVEAAQRHYAQAEDCLASDPHMDVWILRQLLRSNRVFQPIGIDLLMEWFGDDPTEDSPSYIQ